MGDGEDGGVKKGGGSSDEGLDDAASTLKDAENWMNGERSGEEGGQKPSSDESPDDGESKGRGRQGRGTYRGKVIGLGKSNRIGEKQ